MICIRVLFFATVILLAVNNGWSFSPAHPTGPAHPARSRCVHTSRHCVRLTVCTVKSLLAATLVSPAVSSSSHSERRHLIKKTKKKKPKTSVAFVLFPDGRLFFFVLSCFPPSLLRSTNGHKQMRKQKHKHTYTAQNANSQTKHFIHVRFQILILGLLLFEEEIEEELISDQDSTSSSTPSSLFLFDFKLSRRRYTIVAGGSDSIETYLYIAVQRDIWMEGGMKKREKLKLLRLDPTEADGRKLPMKKLQFESHLK